MKAGFLIVYRVGLVLATLGIAGCIFRLWQARRRVTGTTLMTAWQWAAAGMLLWASAWCLTILFPWVERAASDQIWYGVSLVMLCPPMAVLGAKRPAARVWGWFILSPMLLVLGWPALLAWRGGAGPQRLLLPEPALVAYGLVCLMGIGNYLGTRFAPQAALFGVALFWLIAPLSGSRIEWFASPDLCRMWGTLCLTAAVWSAGLSRRRAVSERPPLDRMWIDFRNLYGVVWARRTQDRFNAAASQTNLAVRLEQDGFRLAAGTTAEAQAETWLTAEKTFRWLLRRFVDAEWMEERVKGEG